MPDADRPLLKASAIPAPKFAPDGPRVSEANAVAVLWNLLDNIDTAEDMAKGDDAAFRRLTRRFYRRRFEVAHSDGYGLWYRRAYAPPLAVRAGWLPVAFLLGAACAALIAGAFR